MANLALPTTPTISGRRGEIRLSFVAAEGITAGMAVKLNSSGQLVKADRDTDSVYAWIALNTASAGQAVDVVVTGGVDGFASMTPGVEYYLSDTAGYLCPIDDITAGQNYVPVGVAETATRLFVFSQASVQLPNNTLVIASPARGNVVYYGASAWQKLTNGTKGYALISGGVGADPSYAAQKNFLRDGPKADQGANATVTVKFGSPGTGRKWVFSRIQVLSGTTADATAQLKIATVAASAATALDGDTEITSFTDDTAAAGEAVTVELVTAASTGDLDAAVIIVEFSDLPA